MNMAVLRMMAEMGSLIGQNWRMELKFPGRFYIFCINSKVEIKYTGRFFGFWTLK